MWVVTGELPYFSILLGHKNLQKIKNFIKSLFYLKKIGFNKPTNTFYVSSWIKQFCLL